MGDPWKHNNSLPRSAGEKNQDTETWEVSGQQHDHDAQASNNCPEKNGRTVNCARCEFGEAQSELCRERNEKEMQDAGATADTDETRKERQGGTLNLKETNTTKLPEAETVKPRSDKDDGGQDLVANIRTTDKLLIETPGISLTSNAMTWSGHCHQSELKKMRDKKNFTT